ncbi:MAG: ParB N-terminal domain-containing protein, partial [Candidatus Nitrosopolaris sp.]
HEASDDNANADSFPENIKSRIAMLRVVIDQIGSGFEQARQLILEIAKRLDEGGLCERNHVSITVKKILKDKIKEGKVTEKWIEECLPQEYKRQYTKSEPSSLSKEQPKQQIIEVSTEGEQVSPEQQADDNVIDRSTEGEPSNKLQHANKLKQQDDIPTTANDVEVVKENDDTITSDSLTINDEYAGIMPALYDLEYGSLKSSIQEHGQPFPIVVNQDGVILDGHHRYKACHELGIKPSVLVRQFENQLQEKKFIIEVNRSRRHLNEFQRIELQIKLESIETELAKERMPDPGKIGVEK